MYAVIKSGGKQHRVKTGQSIKLETLAVAEGQTFSFEEVLLVSDGEKVTVGAPYIVGAKVMAEVVGHGRGPKITIIKFKRRQGYRRKQGHRQGFTEVKITSIVAA